MHIRNINNMLAMCTDTTRPSFRIFLLLLLLLLLVPRHSSVRMISYVQASSMRPVPMMMSSILAAAASLPDVVELVAASNSTTAASSQGREFYVAFGRTSPMTAAPKLALSISSAHAQAQIIIEIPDAVAGIINSSLQVAADGTAMRSDLPTSLIQMVANVSQPLVVKVTSLSSVVTVSGWASTSRGSEAYLALPLEALGTRYIVPSTMVGAFPQYVGFIQIVTTDAQLFTNMTITTRVTTSLGSAGTYHLTLAARMAWLMTTIAGGALASVDLGGTEITGSAPFGVIAGHQCTQVPLGEILFAYVCTNG
jgi:hypothetical protein